MNKKGSTRPDVLYILPELCMMTGLSSDAMAVIRRKSKTVATPLRNTALLNAVEILTINRNVESYESVPTSLIVFVSVIRSHDITCNIGFKWRVTTRDAWSKVV